MNRRTLAPPDLPILCAALAVLTLSVGGCAAPERKAMVAHRQGMESIVEDEYFVPKKPVDKAYIGCAWSRQFGPVDDPAAGDIRVRKERSLSKVQQDFAYSRGIQLGAQNLTGQSFAVGPQGGGLDKARVEGVEIIAAVSLADIPFEPDVAYVTEALRLANFRLTGERAAQGGFALRSATQTLAGTPVTAAGGAAAGAGGQSRTATEGEGLVVAYKLHKIDAASYRKQESGPTVLELDRSVDFPAAGLVVKARLQRIEPGAGQSLPRNLLWSCPRAEAKSRNAAAAWLVYIRPLDPKRKSLTIAFPAYPPVEDCQSYSGVVFSRIDPATDRIVRQKIQGTLLESELDDACRPARWDARVLLVDESFNVRLVRTPEIEGR